MVVVGSQAILGTYSADDLPDSVTLSHEVDAAPWLRFVDGASETEIAEAISRINVGVGEGSPFHAEHGFYVEGVDGATIILPAGWDTRLVEFRATLEDGNYERVGFCLHPDDICVSKVIAGRKHDRDYVKALVDARLVSVEMIRERVEGELNWGAHTPDERQIQSAVRFLDWLTG